MPSHRASTVRRAILRNVFLSLAKTRSIGSRSGAVGWQKALRRAGSFDGFANSCDFMGAEIVHHHDLAGRQGRNENLFDISKELCAVDGTIKDTRSSDAVVTQGGHERRRFPVTEGCMGEQPFASLTSPVARGHVGRSPGLIDEHELFGIAPSLAEHWPRPIGGVFQRDSFLLRSRSFVFVSQQFFDAR
jgi:hypothetical protein